MLLSPAHPCKQRPPDESEEAEIQRAVQIHAVGAVYGLQNIDRLGAGKQAHVRRSVQGSDGNAQHLRLGLFALRIRRIFGNLDRVAQLGKCGVLGLLGKEDGAEIRIGGADPLEVARLHASAADGRCPFCPASGALRLRRWERSPGAVPRSSASRWRRRIPRATPAEPSGSFRPGARSSSRRPHRYCRSGIPSSPPGRHRRTQRRGLSPYRCSRFRWRRKARCSASAATARPRSTAKADSHTAPRPAPAPAPAADPLSSVYFFRIQLFTNPPRLVKVMR